MKEERAYVGLYLSHELREKLEQRAKDEDRTLSSLVRVLLTHALQSGA